MDSDGVPAPGLTASFAADEIIIYGIALGRREVFAVKVKNGGSGYSPGTKIRFTPHGAEAEAEVVDGEIRRVTVTRSGEYDVDTIPLLTIDEECGGKDAEFVPFLKNKATLNLEDGRWDIAIEGVRDFDGGREGRLGERFSIVAAYGYAFEGHCYRFDRPRLLGFEHGTGDEMTGAIGCGFDPPVELGPNQKWYRAWRIRSNRRLIELSATVARADELILEANKPGRRPPNTYNSLMRLAHRGGRLSDH